MNWNHRVWQQSFGDETWYDIRETYYNAKGQVTACSAEPDEPHGNTLEELRESLHKMLDAVDAVEHGVGCDVLQLDNFEFAKYEEWEEKAL